MGVKMNSRIITKNHTADPEIGFLTKSISKPNGRATAMPPAWELKLLRFLRHNQICLHKFRFIISSSESISASLFIFRIFGAISLIFARISINFASCIMGFENRKDVFIFS